MIFEKTGLAVPFPYASVGFRRFPPGRYQPLPGGVLSVIQQEERCLMEAVVAIVVAAILIVAVGGHDKEVERDYSIATPQKEESEW